MSTNRSEPPALAYLMAPATEERDRVEAVDSDGEFTGYVNARYPALIRTAYLLTGSHHLAEDLVQSALARTYLAWGRVRRADSIDAYVRRIIVNEHINWWRKPWRRRESSTDTVPGTGVDGGAIERDQELLDAIRRLSPKLRAVIALRYYEDLTEAETAEALGCSVGTVKSRAHRAIHELRSVLVASTPPTPSTGAAEPAGAVGTEEDNR